MRLTPLQYRIALSQRLGLPIVKPGATIDARKCLHCGANLLVETMHPSVCTKLRRGPVTIAHDHIKMLLRNQFERCAMTSSIEMAMLDGKMMDLVAWTPTQTLYIDVSMTNPAAASYRKYAAKTPLFAAHLRERAKETKYHTQVEQQGGVMVPFVIESFGAMPKGVSRLAKKMSTVALSSISVGKPTQSQLLKEIALEVQRQQAIMAISAAAASHAPLQVADDLHS
jgi:hypothetical protein